MDQNEFIKQLNTIQDLMIKEQYNEAINLLEKLKKIEKSSEFNYNLTHRLYQLDSNVHSLHNQQVILNLINKISRKQKSISFQEIKKTAKLEMSDDILRREIELLILRNLLKCEIDGNLLKF